ncbi:MAG: hypothetical protein R3242_07495 [Akkermansiaceae bacterium]|nr:hypothetical protein [Akkermansiaceae bacterium]
MALVVHLVVVQLHAQQKPVVSVRTLQLGGGEMPDVWVRAKDAEGPVKLEWLTSQPTRPVLVIHDGSIKVFRYALGEDGKPKADNIQDIPFPRGAKEVLLLGQFSDGKASYRAIKDRFLDAKFNDWMAINTSPKPVAMRIGPKDSKLLRVDPGKSLIFRPKIEENKGVEMMAMVEHKGEIKTFLSSYWPAFPKQRTVILFYQDGEKTRAKRIGDRFVELEEQKAPVEP